MQAKTSSFQLSTKLRGRSKNTSQVASNSRDDLDPEASMYTDHDKSQARNSRG